MHGVSAASPQKFTLAYCTQVEIGPSDLAGSDFGEPTGDMVAGPARARIARTHFGSVPVIAGGGDAGINDEGSWSLMPARSVFQAFWMQAMILGGYGPRDCEPAVAYCRPPYRSRTHSDQQTG